MQAEDEIETQNAEYLLATLHYRSINLGNRIDCIPEKRIDADVCTFLGSVDASFEAKVEFHGLHARREEEGEVRHPTEVSVQAVNENGVGGSIVSRNMI